MASLKAVSLVLALNDQLSGEEDRRLWDAETLRQK